MGVLLGWLAVVTGLAGAGLHAANEAEGRTSEPSFWLMGLGASLAYGLAALLLRGAEARRIQLLLGGIGLAQGLALLASEWGLLDEQIPLRSWAVWLGSWLWAPAYAAIAAVLPLVLPDGRLPSSRWRPAMWLAVTAVLVTSVTWALTPYDAQDFPEALEGSTNPVGVEGIGAAWVSALGGVLVVAVLTALAALASRWRRAVDVERQQLKWVLAGYVATLFLLVLAQFLPVELVGFGAGLAMLPLPVAIAVAVLRFGLWDVDLVISRGLVYIALSACVVVLYVGSLWLVGDLLGTETGAPILAIAGLALAALPLRSWLQRHVNRLVHGDIDEPYAVLARIGDRLSAATTPEDLTDRVLPSVVEQVARSLRAKQASIELRDGSVTSYASTAGAEAAEHADRAAGVRRGAVRHTDRGPPQRV